LSDCPDDCVYLEPLILKEREKKGELPLYKVMKTTGEGSHAVIVAREKPNGNLQYINVLVDAWKMGLKDCFGSHNIPKLEFYNMVEGAGEPYVDYGLDEALWLIKHGLRIAREVGTPVPDKFKEFEYILGDMGGIEVGGSLYKCFRCGRGELTEGEVEKIKEVAKRDMDAGVCGTPDETMIYFTCSDCKER
jgi:hypothetical protein